MVQKTQMSIRRPVRGAVLAAVGIALAAVTMSAEAAGRPSLGAARSFAVLGASTVTNTGLTVVTGDVGVSPGSAITGFYLVDGGPGTVVDGSIHVTDTAANAAHRDAQICYDFLAGMPSIAANNLSNVDLGGLTLKPGVYKFNAAAALTGDLYLDAQGHSDALFVFQIGTSFVTATGANVYVINGGADYDESNVFWQVGSSATLGVGTDFVGNIIAGQSISIVSGSSLVGDALALVGAVTLDSNAVTCPPVRTGTSPSGGSGKLIPPVGALDTNAAGVLAVKHYPATSKAVERSTFQLKVSRLDANLACTLWADDPSTLATDLVQFGAFTTKKDGTFTYTLDTKLGNAMPFGATLLQLSGQAIEVRNSAGTVTLLVGTIPTSR